MSLHVDIVEASIAQLRAWLESGHLTSLQLVQAYYERMDCYDTAGIMLNAVVVRNPDALRQAHASDARRREGQTLGPLEGIAYTAKDSYLARGLNVAAGSPAFASLVATRNAFTIEQLERAGAILLGLTNMPPMANGGMQRGVYGRAESPYSATYLTSAFASGSSNGSGTATAASFAAFGLAEETWSSGRAPASYNGLCAYTPSRGLISTRGNWPLVPTMDVVVPHTRSMSDLLEVLDVIVRPDSIRRGDFWRAQPWVKLPSVDQIRPVSYREIAKRATVSGTRFGVPRMYINADEASGTHPNPGIGGSTGQRIHTRESVCDLWQELCQRLAGAQAAVVAVDFPLVSNYEADRPGATTIFTSGFVSPEYLKTEIVALSAWAWEDFLQANGDPNLHSLVSVDPETIFPHPPGALPDRYDGFDDDITQYPRWVCENPATHFTQLADLSDGLAGLERMRRNEFEAWMDRNQLDALIFPTVADVGLADMDTNPVSAQQGWRNGVWVANGNLALRHAGIPSVTIPMGSMHDTGMPVGVTIIGRGFDDTTLLALGYAIERMHPCRVPPPRTPPLS